jgi:hypothetical protein
MAMKRLFPSLFLAAGLVSAHAGDAIFATGPLGKAVLQSNERLARAWFFEVTGGPVFGVNGDLTHSSSASWAYLDALNFEDLYGNAWSLGFRTGRAIGPYDAYFRFAYTQADGGGTQVGATVLGPITGVFSDYSDFALLGGIRREFMQPSRLHPYLGFEAGVRFVDSIDASFTFAGLGRTGNLPFYDEGAVFTSEVTVGVSYDVTDAFRLGIESGLRYQGGLDKINNGPLGGFDNGDSLLFVPLMMTGRVSF